MLFSLYKVFHVNSTLSRSPPLLVGKFLTVAVHLFIEAMNGKSFQYSFVYNFNIMKSI